jgi:hypothetical protein
LAQENFEYAIRIHREILESLINKDADRVEALERAYPHRPPEVS